MEFFEEITHHFGVPNRIITDNGTNFMGYEFKDWCSEHGIKLSLTSIAHPKANGQVERANGAILKAAKARIFEIFNTQGGPMECT